MPILDKDMTLCISLSGRPSNVGTRFHNFLYDELGLPFVYKGFRTDDLPGAIHGVRALGIRGASISMPFKEAVIPLVDVIEPSAEVIGAVNTIVNDDGRLTASNTDVEAVEQLLGEHGVDPDRPVVLRGSGGMARAVAAAFRRAGTRTLTIVARNEAAGTAVAQRFDAEWRADVPDPTDAVLVNVTPIGMHGGDEDALSFTHEAVEAAHTIVDVVAFPIRTPLVRLAERLDKPVITGGDVITLQAARQFERYTGQRPTAEQIARAGAFSRAS